MLCRSFLRSHSQPKPRRNPGSRYAKMMATIRSRSERTGSSDSGSLTTRRARSSSIPSPSSQTNPTSPYQNSDHGRLGTGFSILKPEESRSRISQASSPKILALPPWLQDTITELDPSHPLRVVFPTLHDAPDPGIVNHSFENSLGHQNPRSTHPNDANRSFRFPPTPRIQSKACHPDSDTSSDELKPTSPNYPLYRNNSLLHLRSGSPSLSIGVLSQSGDVFPTATAPYPSSSARINVADAHTSDFETTPLSASSSNHDPPDRVFPSPRRNVEYDGIFRYNPPQTVSTTGLPPPQPFIFERPIQVYFDSPIEDPIGSDPLEPHDHDPFKLDLDEYKNLGFKWAPFDLQTGIAGREPTTDEPETSARSPGSD